MELSQLIRYSPKQSALFENLQSQMSLGSPSLKPLCPTRWTVHCAAINSVLKNYAVLCEALAEINTTTHDEYGRRAGGFLSQMEKFSTYFGLKLSHLIFSGTEQLSITLQGKNTTVQEAVTAAELTVNFLERLQQDNSFDEFYSRIVEAAKEFTSPLTLPRYRKPPRRPGNVGTASHDFDTAQSYFRKQYFEVLELLINELKRGLPDVAAIEKMLLDAANGSAEQVSNDLQIYKNDLDLVRLQTQLHMLPDLIRIRNMMPTCDVPITRVTNIRTLCEVINEVSMSKVMFSEVYSFDEDFLHNTCYHCNCREDIFSTWEIENLFRSYNVTNTT